MNKVSLKPALLEQLSDFETRLVEETGCFIGGLIVLGRDGGFSVLLRPGVDRSLLADTVELLRTDLPLEVAPTRPM